MVLEMAVSVLVFLYVHLTYILSLFLSLLPLPELKIHKVKRWPKVSVVIAARDESKVLGHTLDAVMRSDYTHFEIVVVTSDKKTAKIARKRGARVILSPPKGKPAALNVGVKHSKGDVIYFLDADSVVEKDTIRKVVAGLNKENAISLGGGSIRNADSFTALAARLHVFYIYSLQALGKRALKTTMGPTRNFAIYKHTLQRLGGFRDVLTEDIDQCIRANNRGYGVEFVPDALCHETVPRKFYWYLKQQRRWLGGSLQEVLRGAITRHSKRTFITTPVALLLAFSPAAAFIFFVLGYFWQSAFLLAVPLLVFLYSLSSAARFGKWYDVLMSPLTFAWLSVVQFFVLIYAVFWIASGRARWERTPK